MSAGGFFGSGSKCSSPPPDRGWATGDDVVAVSSEAVNRYPRDVDFLLNLGMSYLMNHDRRGAMATMKQLEALDDAGEGAIWLRGAVAWDRGDAEAALAEYRSMTDSSRRDFYIGDCLAALGNDEAALLSYRVAIKRAPFRAKAVANARSVPGSAAGSTAVLPRWLWSAMHRKGIGPLARAVADRRLLHVLRRRGESNSLHAAIAHVALLRGDLERTRRFAWVAVDIGDTRAFEAAIDSVVAAVVAGVPQEIEVAKHRATLTAARLGLDDRAFVERATECVDRAAAGTRVSRSEAFHALAASLAHLRTRLAPPAVGTSP